MALTTHTIAELMHEAREQHLVLEEQLSIDEELGRPVLRVLLAWDVELLETQEARILVAHLLGRIQRLRGGVTP